MAIDSKILEAAKKVTAHRAKTVIDHIIEHGFITTEDLKVTYGYNHPPRAAGDVRDQGIPLETFKVTGSDGRKIAAYRFGKAEEIEAGKLGGRRILPKQLKESLVEVHGSRCAITCEEYDKGFLQIDHRIPYRVAGDTDEVHKVEDYMLLCGSAQRQKSWACEHCSNFTNNREIENCKTCYWAYPEQYEHIAMSQERQVTVIFNSNEIQLYERVVRISEASGDSIQTIIKETLKRT